MSPAVFGDLSRDRFERVLRGHEIADPETAGRRSAVAAVLRFERGVPQVLLMKRAERPGDRWSGQISLPGGREDRSDRDLLATAIRETEEEVGLKLAEDARLIGRLQPIPAIAHGRVMPMVIAPFVFVETRPGPLVLGPEAQAGFWLPLDQAAAGVLAGEYPYRMGATVERMPCWEFSGHIIWGLTYRMLGDLLALVDVSVPRWQPPPR